MQEHIYIFHDYCTKATELVLNQLSTLIAFGCAKIALQFLEFHYD